jgi:hypothetical protein
MYMPGKESALSIADSPIVLAGRVLEVDQLTLTPCEIQFDYR